MDDLEHFRALYQAFNRRDIDAVLAMMSEEVDWANAWKGGRLVGREAARGYWSAQWAEIDPHVEPLSVTERVRSPRRRTRLVYERMRHPSGVAST